MAVVVRQDLTLNAKSCTRIPLECQYGHDLMVGFSTAVWETAGNLGVEPEEGGVWEEKAIVLHRPPPRKPRSPGQLSSIVWRAAVIPGDLLAPTGSSQTRSMLWS